MPAVERETLISKSLSTFLVLFLVLSVLFGGMVAVFYQLQTQNYAERLRAEERHSLELQLAVARNHFTSIIGDLTFLAGQEDLKAYLEDSSDQHLASVRREYLTYSISKKTYDQIRYLDEFGQEVARVNYNAGTPEIVTNEKLQNKSNRYYFSDAFILRQGEVFISPLDLNVELGKVELPYKPMIRFGTPVFDQSGTKRGIVLLNYLGQNLINLIRDVGAVARGRTMLVNSEGYWLMHPDAEQEWGFMFPDKADLSFAKQSPDVWTQIMASPSGQFRTAEGIYTFTSLSPFGSKTEELAKSGDYSWKIVSFISAKNLASYSYNLLVNLLAFGLGLLLLAAVVAWFLAVAVTRRKLYQAQLFSMAHFDSLTGLPNRALFFDRLNQSLELAKRHGRQCALLYIDLDGFKYVNDSIGHDAGDDLLVAVAKRMEQCCRDSDTVARLGGDEFAILLTEVNSVEGVQICTEKLLSALETPFNLKQGETKIGASIGIGMFPTHGVTLDALLKSADQAMYVSKSCGKNTFTFAKD